MKLPQHPVEVRHFQDDGRTPNHPFFPLLLYRDTGIAAEEDPAACFEKVFRRNGWGSTWRWSIYPYHHFHTTNHEVLGVASGTARVLFGGDHGEEHTLRPGDVVVIPAGVAHCCVEASDDFLVVGAYPGGKEPDLLRESESREVRDRIADIPLPPADPIHGPGGPLFRHWRRP